MVERANPPSLPDETVRAYSPSVVQRAALYGLLSDCAARAGVALVSAPAGSGKTVLLRSWLNAAGLSARAAWVSVERGETSPQNFWRCVIEALQGILGAEPLRVTPTPDFDGNDARRASVVRTEFARCASCPHHR